MTKLLRIEAFGFLLLTLFLYYLYGFSWIWFAILFFAPDISMLGYLKNPRFGALIYNAAHFYLIPIIILIISWYIFGYTTWLVVTDFTWQLSLIWIAHISLDRTLGYGLKLSTGFKDTHLGRIGRK
ncbi:DUF4260 domain-containing protein [Candidatus Parcubacteria bacterium]|nr:DUF4260 domain-containing protein [Candidatus Parcubacteria bacterium]